MGWGEFLTNVPGTTVGLSQVEPGSNDAPAPAAPPHLRRLRHREEPRAPRSKGRPLDGETREIPAWSSSRPSSTPTATPSCSPRACKANGAARLAAAGVPRLGPSTD
jgi:hypothetical protein